MPSAEGQTIILYYSELTGEWPEEGPRALRDALRYDKRLRIRANHDGRASLTGIALALRALQAVSGRLAQPVDLLFPQDGKPCLQPGILPGQVDFSIAHSGSLVGCAASASGAVGLDIELGPDERAGAWVRREAAVKALGLGITAARGVKLTAAGAELHGRALHGQAFELAGACACVMSVAPIGALEVRSIELAELFAAHRRAA